MSKNYEVVFHLGDVVFEVEAETPLDAETHALRKFSERILENDVSFFTNSTEVKKIRLKAKG